MAFLARMRRGLREESNAVCLLRAAFSERASLITCPKILKNPGNCCYLRPIASTCRPFAQKPLSLQQSRRWPKPPDGAAIQSHPTPSFFVPSVLSRPFRHHECNHSTTYSIFIFFNSSLRSSPPHSQFYERHQPMTLPNLAHGPHHRRRRMRGSRGRGPR